VERERGEQHKVVLFLLFYYLIKSSNPIAVKSVSSLTWKLRSNHTEWPRSEPNRGVTLRSSPFLQEFLPMKNKKGFSLIEILVVAAIVGIIVTVALSAMGKYYGDGNKLNQYQHRVLKNRR